MKFIIKSSILLLIWAWGSTKVKASTRNFSITITPYSNCNFMKPKSLDQVNNDSRNGSTDDNKPSSPLKKRQSNVQSFLQDLMLGGVSGGVSKTIVAPIERVKLILRKQAESIQISSEDPRYRGFYDAFRRLPKEYGFFYYW